MEQYLIIADDFTGANDTGVQLCRRGIPVNVVFKDTMIKDRSSFVIDTESRGLTEKEAFNKVLQSITHLSFDSFSHVIKKVDSTLRGNIGSETKAVDQYYKPELIIFAPALPDLGRTTVNAVQLLQGTPVAKTEIARDPKTPVTEDNIQHLFQKTFSDETVTHIGLDEVRKDNYTLEGGRIFTFDAETNRDMQNLIAKALNTKKRILWAGTAALADNLLGIKQMIPPSLGIVASLSSVTRTQVLFAEKQGIPLVKVPLYDILEKKTDVLEIAEEAAEVLKTGKDVILLSSSTYSAEEYEKAEAAAKRHGCTTEQMSAYTQKVMGRISDCILNKVTVSGIFLAGGDTAMSFFDIAESEGSAILAEIAVGIPLMRLRGGRFEGLKIVTKAGAFGKEDAVFYALRKLREADL